MQPMQLFQVSAMVAPQPMSGQTMLHFQPVSLPALVPHQPMQCQHMPQQSPMQMSAQLARAGHPSAHHAGVEQQHQRGSSELHPQQQPQQAMPVPMPMMVAQTIVPLQWQHSQQQGQQQMQWMQLPTLLAHQHAQRRFAHEQQMSGQYQQDCSDPSSPGDEKRRHTQQEGQQEQLHQQHEQQRDGCQREGSQPEQQQSAQRDAAGSSSVGSRGHPDLCRPCLFHAQGRCTKGAGCGCCHVPHPKRPIRFDKLHREALKRMPFEHLVSIMLPVLREKYDDIKPYLEPDVCYVIGDLWAHLEHFASLACVADGVAESDAGQRQPRRRDGSLVSVLQAMGLRSLLATLAPKVPSDEVALRALVEDILQRILGQRMGGGATSAATSAEPSSLPSDVAPATATAQPGAAGRSSWRIRRAGGVRSSSRHTGASGEEGGGKGSTQ